jgi:hypothetical protein
MYSPGVIIYFDPFYFKNGNPCKPKYFIVLSVSDGKSLVASLPTRVDHVPSYVESKHGCIDIPHANFNCYHFEMGKIVCDNGFSFPMPTYIYGYRLDEYEIGDLNAIYPIEGVDYSIEGTLTETDFKALILCFSSSRAVKMKFRRILEKQLT